MKRIRTKSQQGIGAVAIIAIVGVVALIGILGYVLFTNMNSDDNDTNTNENSNTSQDATDEAATEDAAPADEELKGVSVGMTRAEVEGVYGQPTSTCMDYPDGSQGCAYSNAELIGAGNGFEVAYKDGVVSVATFTDNSANTIQQLTKDGLETVQ